MLSVEYTLDEIKRHLDAYTVYGYASVAEFEQGIEDAINDAKYEDLYRYISDHYDNGYIQTISSSSSGREDFLKNLYDNGYMEVFFAEVYYSLAKFLKYLDDKDIQSGATSLSGSSFAVEGYSQSDSSGSSPSSDTNPFRKQSAYFYRKARENMMLADYDVLYSVSRVRGR